MGMAPQPNKDSSGRKGGRGKQIQQHQQQDCNSNSGYSSGEDYRKRRDRNNLAVKRSRVKSKLRTQQTMERVNQLKSENEMLEEKIRLLTKELSFLKDLFMAHAGSSQGLKSFENINLESLLLLHDDSSNESERIKSLQEGERIRLERDDDNL